MAARICIHRFEELARDADQGGTHNDESHLVNLRATAARLESVLTFNPEHLIGRINELRLIVDDDLINAVAESRQRLAMSSGAAPDISRSKIDEISVLRGKIMDWLDKLEATTTSNAPAADLAIRFGILNKKTIFSDPDFPLKAFYDALNKFKKEIVSQQRALSVEVVKELPVEVIPEVSLEQFLYLNVQEAERLGLERVEIQGSPEAQKMLERIFDQSRPDKFDVANLDDKKSKAEIAQFVAEWKQRVPNIPVPCEVAQGYTGYLKALATGKIIKNLDKDHPFSGIPHWERSAVLWMENWQEQDWDTNDKLKTTPSPLLQELGIKQSDNKLAAGAVNISREAVDTALWVGGDQTKKQKTPQHIALLQKLGLDPAVHNFRLIAQDEYARLNGVGKNFGKSNLWTWFNDYWVEGGDVYGLNGGNRGRGGPSGVGRSSRGLANAYLAVRLVLERVPRASEIKPIEKMPDSVRSREDIIAIEKSGTIQANLHHVFKEAISIYHANKWAAAINAFEADLPRFTPDQLAWMDQMRQQGNIIFPMPGRDIIEAHFSDVLEKLRPFFRDAHQKVRQAEQTAAWAFVNEVAQESLLGEIPKDSYFAVFSPSAMTPLASRNKTVDEQADWIKQQSISESRRRMNIVTDEITPIEWVFAQMFWTEKGGEVLDFAGRLRFAKIPNLTNSLTLCAYWSIGNDRLNFRWGERYAKEDAGIRLISRVTPAESLISRILGGKLFIE